MGTTTLALLMIVPGVALFALGWLQLTRRKSRFQEQLQSWRETTGAILDCCVEKVAEFENGENWRPRVRYAFDANGTSFEGSSPRLNAPLDFDDKAGAARWTETRQPGTAVPVWYDPEQPQSNTLEMDAPGVASFPLIGVLGIVLGITGLIIILFV